MTANPQVQSLITELDRLLNTTADRETATVSPDFLQRLRDVLSDRVAAPVSPNAIATAVVEQLHQQNALNFNSSVSPSEVMALRQQRDTLKREIQNLENQRHHLIENFLQVLLSRLSESLKQEISQTVESIESQFLYAIAPTSENTSPDAIALTNLPGNPSQRLEQLKYLQQESDRLFMSLDSTFQTVFSTLQKDLTSYQEALAMTAGQMYNAARQNPENPPSGSQPLNLPLDHQDSAKDSEIDPSERYQAVTPVQLPDSEAMYPFAGMELPTAAPAEVVPETPAAEREPLNIDEMNESEIDELLQLNEEDLKRNEAAAAEIPQPQWETALFGEDSEPTPRLETPVEEETPLTAEPEVTLEDADTPEAQLFGEATPESTPVSAEVTPTSAVVEQELFTEAPEASPETPADDEPSEEPNVTSPTPPEIPTTNEAEASDTSRTISSLTDLLSQAYVDADPDPDSDAEIAPFTSVPVGENLAASEESDSTPPPAVTNNLDSEQLEQLDEDLQRFQEGETRETATAETATPPAADSDEIPAELIGENLEQVSVESLAQEEEDMWAETPSEETPETEIKMPAEINPEPWSGSTSSTPEDYQDRQS